MRDERLQLVDDPAGLVIVSPGAPPSAPFDPAPLEARIAALEARVTALETAP